MKTAYHLHCELCKQLFISEASEWEIFCAGCIQLAMPLIRYTLRKAQESPYFYPEYQSFLDDKEMQQ